MLRTALRTFAMVQNQGVAPVYVPRLLRHGVVPVQRAQGRMFSLQDSLPTLPVPPLQQTLDKFLRTAQPLLSEEDLDRTARQVREFASKGSVGEKLQFLLEEKAKKHVNWLSEWWLNVAYLEFRAPVAIHVNPGIVFPSQKFSGPDEYIRYAAQMVSGLLDYKRMIDDQSLPVEYMGGKPLCMKQFYNILAGCRIPGVKKDQVVHFPPDQPNAPKHIVVMHNNHFFSLRVFGSNNEPLSTSQLEQQLRKIVSQSQEPAPPVGILTTDNRNTWGKAYAKLSKDPHNKAILEEIQRSIFNLCLDKPMAEGVPEEDIKSIAANQMNHGGGTKYNSGNRWFDKTIQFIVSSDGAVGLNYEHAPAEGPPIISLVDHTLSFIKTKGSEDKAAPDVQEPKHLKFNLTSDIEDTMVQSGKLLDSTVADLCLRNMSFTGFGKNFPKTQKMSPDAFIQVCFQLAYYRLYGRSAPTYESGSLRQFQEGRTDTIRSCSIASHKYCQAMDDPSQTPQAKSQLFRDAVAAHRQHTNEIVQGQGIDRHLLGLKLIALENGLDIPELLMDTGYTSTCNWQLSTSQVGSKNSAVLCFAPVIPDGYGVCYNPMETQFNICVSSWNSCPETDARKLVKSIESAFTDTQNVLLQTQKSKL